MYSFQNFEDETFKRKPKTKTNVNCWVKTFKWPKSALNLTFCPLVLPLERLLKIGEGLGFLSTEIRLSDMYSAP